MDKYQRLSLSKYRIDRVVEWEKWGTENSSQAFLNRNPHWYSDVDGRWEVLREGWTRSHRKHRTIATTTATITRTIVTGTIRTATISKNNSNKQ